MDVATVMVEEKMVEALDMVDTTEEVYSDVTVLVEETVVIEGVAEDATPRYNTTDPSAAAMITKTTATALTAAKP